MSDTVDRERLYDQGEKIGQINGKVDSLLQAFERHIQETREFRSEMVVSISNIEADINKAKGAKAAILGTAGVVAAAISTAVAALGKLL